MAKGRSTACLSPIGVMLIKLTRCRHSISVSCRVTPCHRRFRFTAVPISELPAPIETRPLIRQQSARNSLCHLSEILAINHTNDLNFARHKGQFARARNEKGFAFQDREHCSIFHFLHCRAQFNLVHSGFSGTNRLHIARIRCDGFTLRPICFCFLPKRH